MNNEKKYTLPNFIYNAIKGNNTSLGDCEAFPPDDEFGYLYTLIKHRYKEVVDVMDTYDYTSAVNNEFIFNRLSELLIQTKELEAPIIERLETVCFNLCNRMLGIPQDTVMFECHIVDKVDDDMMIRITPENVLTSGEYSFNDVDEIESLNKEVKKRRVVDALIMGASIDLSRYWEAIGYELSNSIGDCSDLIERYKEITALEDYFLFTKKVNITNDFSPQNGFVEVRLGHGEQKTTIKASGVIFPYMLQESLRGFFELFSSHGLPDDNKLAMYIIKKSDFMMAEPWDIRIGIPMWRKIMSNVNSIKTNVLPYLFSDLCSLKYDKFNNVMKNLLAGTNKGKNDLESEIQSIKDNEEYRMFKDKMKQKNVDLSLINDDNCIKFSKTTV